MQKDKKARLLLTVVIATMVVLYIGPLMVAERLSEVEQVRLSECIKTLGGYSSTTFDLCWKNSKSSASLPFFVYAAPFIPALLLLWYHWFAKLDLRMPGESFPKKTMTVLLGLGFLVGALGVYAPINTVVQYWSKDFDAIEGKTFFIGPLIALGFISPVFLFYRLLGPIDLVASHLRLAKVALWLVVLLPLVSGLVFMIRVLTSS